MDKIREKHLRPGRKILDQFIVASVLASALSILSVLLIPKKAQALAFEFFKSILGGDQDAASAENGPFYNVNFGVEGSLGAVVILIALGVVLILKNRGKTEHTDVWVQADQAAIEKKARSV